MRYVLGPGFDAIIAAPPAPSAPQGGTAPAVPPKSDVAVTLLSKDDAAKLAVVQIPAYDLATHNRLSEVRLYLLPSGAARPADANGYVQSSYPVETADVSQFQGGADVSIPYPGATPGQHLGQIVLGFES